MVTYAYKDNIWRNLTEFAYQAHIKAGKDVSGYTSLSAPVTPTAPTAPNQPWTIPTNTATTPTAPQKAWLTDAMKWTDVYKQLLAQGYDEQTISDSVSAYQASRPTTATTTNTNTNTASDTYKWPTEIWNWNQFKQVMSESNCINEILIIKTLQRLDFLKFLIILGLIIKQIHKHSKLTKSLKISFIMMRELDNRNKY